MPTLVTQLDFTCGFIASHNSYYKPEMTEYNANTEARESILIGDDDDRIFKKNMQLSAEILSLIKTHPSRQKHVDRHTHSNYNNKSAYTTKLITVYKKKFTYT